ncbi:hypothetical protein [Microcoleus sp. D3_18_C2]|uniref:hypothetical protein n=1 Tax=Microcoleus sp. D3_18_C2 TaxID=3055334 RepID=UPI002FCFAE6D
MPVPQENSLFVEQAEKPVPKKLIENGATSQILPNRAIATANYCSKKQYNNKS